MPHIYQRTIISLLACAAVAATASEPASTVGAALPAAAPLSLDTWLARREPAYLAPLAVSADGRWLAVALQGQVRDGTSTLPREAGCFATSSEDQAGSEVLLVERATGMVTRPFSQFVGSYTPVWSPSGTRLLVAIQDSATRFPRLALWSPGEAVPRIVAEAAFRPKIGFSAPAWTPDGKRIVFPLVEVAPPAAKPRLTRAVLPEPADAVAGPAAQLPAETLAVLEVATGQVRALAGFRQSGFSGAWGFRLAPGGTRVAYLAHAAALKQGVEANWVRLTVADLASGQAQAFGEPQMEGWGLGLSWSPDGSRIAWQASPGTAKSQEKLLIATVGPANGDGGSLREAVLPKGTQDDHLVGGQEGPFGPPLWAQDGAGFWIAGKNALLHYAADGSRLADLALPAGKGGSDWLENAAPPFAAVRTQAVPASGEVVIVRTREIERVNLRTGAVVSVVAGTAGQERGVDWPTSTVFALRALGDHGWEVVQTSLVDGRSARVAVVHPGMGAITYGQTRTLTWKSAEGKACAGTVLLPVGWKQGDRPPAMIEVYGGDRGMGGMDAEAMGDASLIINPHLLSARGYAFFRPDMPQTAAEPAASLVRSAEAAADALVASGLVDPARIGVMGQSYGGYTALCVLTGTKRFKAGIVANGVYDLFRADTDEVAQAGAMVEAGQGRMGASLWEKPQRFMENSPLHALDRLQAPLLVLQGEADVISMRQGPALFASLRRLGKTAEYLCGADMDHVPTSWSVEIQRELVPAVLRFLDTQVKAAP